MSKLILGILLMVSAVSCTTPRDWGPDRHFEAMSQCQYMCDEWGVKRYSPLLGTCECNITSRQSTIEVK